jgi:hypothetical protein
MPKLISLLNKLRQDYPELTFTSAERYQFSPPATIYFDASNPEPLLLLHELGHYLLKQYDYTSDIELLRIESAAWQQAKQLCATYHIEWDEDFAEDRLDSYRNWLHANSLCPDCQISGYQDTNGAYHCPLCTKKWPGKYLPE